MATQLKKFREELRLAQEDLARAADMRLGTYRKAEQGKNISYTTATTILRALNTLRTAQGLSTISLEDMELSIV